MIERALVAHRLSTLFVSVLLALLPAAPIRAHSQEAASVERLAHGDVQMLYASDGQVGCREATPEEARLLDRGPDGVPLHVLTSPEREMAGFDSTPRTLTAGGDPVFFAGGRAGPRDTPARRGRSCSWQERFILMA